MRINARAFLPSTLLLSLVAGPFIPAASADLAAVSYTGTIQSGGTVSISGTQYAVQGDKIKGTFTYAAPTPNPSSTGSYTLSGLSPAPTFTFTITSIASGNPTQPLGPPAFTDNYVSGSTAYQAVVTSSSTTNLSLTGPMANSTVTNPILFNLSLVDSTTATGLALPGTSTIVSFFSPTNSTLTLTDDVEGNSESFTATIDSVAAIAPEPSSLLIAILTLVTGAVGFLIRPKPRTSQTGQIASLPHA